MFELLCTVESGIYKEPCFLFPWKFTLSQSKYCSWSSSLVLTTIGMYCTSSILYQLSPGNLHMSICEPTFLKQSKNKSNMRIELSLSWYFIHHLKRIFWESIWSCCMSFENQSLNSLWIFVTCKRWKSHPIKSLNLDRGSCKLMIATPLPAVWR